MKKVLVLLASLAITAFLVTMAVRAMPTQTKEIKLSGCPFSEKMKFPASEYASPAEIAAFVKCGTPIASAQK